MLIHEGGSEVVCVRRRGGQGRMGELAAALA